MNPPLSAPRVFVLGSFVQACCWHVGRQPARGETVEADRFQIEPGGKGLNVAVGLQRLGARVQALIGCGQDPASDALLALLAREGLPAKHVHRLPGLSGWGSGLIGSDGHNSIAVYLGANRLLTAAHAEAARADIEAAQLVYGQFETALEAMETAFGIAQASGVPTLLNPSPWREPTPGLRQSTHTLIVNQVEASQLLALPHRLGDTTAQAARTASGRLQELAASWPALRRLVITLGAQGALGAERAADSGRWDWWHAAPPRITAIDTVGAGDGFISAYVLATTLAQPLPVALHWGNLCGAHVAARAGVLDALPHAHELEKRLSGDAPDRAVRPIQVGRAGAQPLSGLQFDPVDVGVAAEGALDVLHQRT